MQTMPPFYLLLRYVAADADASPEEAKSSDSRNAIATAMRALNKAQKSELVSFCNALLAGDRDPKVLARIFEDGHLYIVWRTSDGPKQYLTLIRDVAEEQLRGTAAAQKA